MEFLDSVEEGPFYLQVSFVDVMPSLLAACGIDIPDCVQGVVLPKPGKTPK